MSSSQIASPRFTLNLARFRPFRLVKRVLPRGLFWRSLIIIVAPVVLLQGVVSYVFFERDVDTTTRWMARDAAADVAFLIGIENNTPQTERPPLRALAARMLGYRVTFHPVENLPPSRRHHRSSLDTALDQVIAQQMGGNADFHTERVGDNIDIQADVK